MTTTILLSALEPEERLPILKHLERDELAFILGKSTSNGNLNKMCDRIAHDDNLSSQIEITIRHGSF